MFMCMWLITQCFGLGFRGSHRAGDSVPLPGPPDPPDMAPDPHDDGDFEGPDTRSLVGRDVYIWFADNMTRRYRVFLNFLCMDGDEVSTATMCPLHSALHAGAPEIYWI